MDLYEHAAGLGGGPEAALGFVEGALREGRPLSGPVYAAACRCAHPFGHPLPAANGMQTGCSLRPARDVRGVGCAVMMAILSRNTMLLDRRQVRGT